MDGNRSSTTAMNDLVTHIVKPDKDSSRMHVFCLEHAAEVEKQLQSLGGAYIVLLCRPGQSLGSISDLIECNAIVSLFYQPSYPLHTFRD
jgi:hypothetical protein